MPSQDELIELFFVSDRTWEMQYESPREIGTAAAVALERSRASGDAAAELRAILALGAYEIRFGNIEASRAHAIRAHELARELQDRTSAYRADFLDVLALFFEGRGEESVPRIESILERGQLDLKPFESAQFHCHLAGEFMDIPDRQADMFRHFFLALRELDKIDCLSLRLLVLSNMAFAHLNFGNSYEAKRLFEETLSLGARIPDSLVLSQTAANYMLLLADMDAKEEDFILLEPFLANFANMPPVSRPFLETTYAYFKARRGDADGAEVLIKEAEALSAGIADPDPLRQKTIMSEISWVRGLIAGLRADHQTAFARCTEALNLARELDDPEMEIRLGRDAARFAYEKGAHAEAYLILREAMSLEHGRLGMSLKSMAMTLQVQYEVSRIKEERDKAVLEAGRDALTGLYNRRACESKLAELISGRSSGEGAFSLCVLDLDRFKEVNDGHGHDSGDMVLTAFARELERVFRDRDLVARWGGEEFIVILGDAGARAAKSRLDSFLGSFACMEIGLRDGSVSGITFSAGIAEFPLNGMEFHDIFKAADQSLYRAKESGRACVVIAPDPGSSP